MRGSAESMTLLRASSAGGAVRLYARTPGAIPLAGGTDLMVLWNMGVLNGRTILDLSGVREWSTIRAGRRGVRIGALATHAVIQEHPAVRRGFPLLVQACATVGAAQIQNRGTLGGNIANASPAGDTFPPLAVYEARVRAVGPGGRREVPILEIWAGVKKTTLAAGELIEAVELPALPGRPSRQMFRKIGTRAAQAISKVVMAGLLWVERGCVKELRLALGSVAPTARRARMVEEFARGKPLSHDMAAEAARQLARDISPIDDFRSTAEYRLGVAQNLLREFLKP